MLPVVVLVLAALGPALAKKTAMSRHQLELKEHYDHLAKIAEFECDQPQPRLLHVNDLFPDFQTRGKAYFPEVTVLHRCDRHVGSCNDATYRCGPTDSSEISLPFKVTFLEEMDGHHKGEWKMEYYPLVNHTTCGCLKNVDPEPPKTTVQPDLIPPKGFLPLEPTSPIPDNNSEQNYTGTSIKDMAQATEDTVKPKPDEGSGEKPSEESDMNMDNDKDSQSPIPQPTSTSSPCNTDEVDPTAIIIPNEWHRFGQDERSGTQTDDFECIYNAYFNQAS